MTKHKFKPFLKRNKLSYDVVFTMSCLYGSGKINGMGVNTLFGLNYGWKTLHNTSFGWRPTDSGRIQIYAVQYCKSHKKEEKLCELEVDLYYNMTIRTNNESSIFSVFDSNGLVVAYKKFKTTKNINFGYESSLELSELNIAPHDIYVFMRRQDK